MKVYFVYSKSYEKLLREAECRILINFATLGTKGKIDIPKGFPEIIIDSGGYQLQVGVATRLYAEGDVTGKKKFKNPRIDTYAMWLSDILPSHPEISGYFNLDILGDGMATLENQFAMEKYGIKPIPIWHLGEGEEYLDYYRNNYEYISVGGLIAGSASKKQLKQLTTLLNQKYPGPNYHYFGIGITGTSVFQEARPYSVDFSTWSNAARFGNQIVFDSKQVLKEESLPNEVREKMIKYKIKCPEDKCQFETEFAMVLKKHLIADHNYSEEDAKRRISKAKRVQKSKEACLEAEFIITEYLKKSIVRIKELETSIETIHSDDKQLLML